MDRLHETKRKLADDIKELRKEKRQLTMKLSQELCSRTNRLESNDEYVAAIKESIADIEAELEGHAQALDEIKLKEASIQQTPQKSNLTPPRGTIE